MKQQQDHILQEDDIQQSPEYSNIEIQVKTNQDKANDEVAHKGIPFSDQVAHCSNDKDSDKANDEGAHAGTPPSD